MSMHGRLLGGMVVAIATLGVGGCAGPQAGQQRPTPPASLVMDEQELRDDAVAYLRSRLQDEYPLYRANAIEALQFDPELGEQAARAGLEDENLAVRFVSAFAIGKHRYTSSAALAHALLRDPSPSVVAAATLALKNNGREVDLGALAKMLQSADPTTAGNAALVLGEIGDESAIGLLRDALHYAPPQVSEQEQRIVQLQIAEAMAKLGDPTAVARIRTQLYARAGQDGELTALAASMLGDLNAVRTIPDLTAIVGKWKQYRHSAEVRLAALKSLAQLGEPMPVELVTEYLGSTFQDPVLETARSIRSQAIYVLGHYPADAVLGTVAMSFLDDPREEVRLQAAAAIVRLVPPESLAREESVGDVLTPLDLP